MFWQRGVHRHGEPDAFLLGLDIQHLQDFLDDAMGFGPGGLDLQAAGLHFGQVQNVIDQVEQVFTAAVNRIQVAQAVRRVLPVAALENLGEAENGVHGGADLMAHIGQKNAFGLVGGFGFLFGSNQFALFFLQLGDIVETDQDAGVLAALSQHRRTIDVEGLPAIGGVRQAQNMVGLGFAAGERLYPGTVGLLDRPTVFIEPGQLSGPIAQQMLGGLIQNGGKGTIGQHDLLFTVEHQQPAGQGVQGRPHPSGDGP